MYVSARMSGVFLFHLRGLDLSRMNVTLAMIERSRFRTQGCKQGEEEEEYLCCAVPLSLPSGWIVGVHRWAHCHLFTSHAPLWRASFPDFLWTKTFFLIGYLSVQVFWFVHLWTLIMKSLIFNCFKTKSNRAEPTNGVDYCERLCPEYQREMSELVLNIIIKPNIFVKTPIQSVSRLLVMLESLCRSCNTIFISNKIYVILLWSHFLPPITRIPPNFTLLRNIFVHILN